MIKKIGLASDHAGYRLKSFVAEYLKDKEIEIEDFGCDSDVRCDYADYAHPLANAVEREAGMIGIVCCGSGNGINMTVNKHQGIRSALCWNVEVSRLARSHNDANICSLPARFISEEEALEIIDVFLSTKFEKGRHSERIKKIPLEGIY
jgi:ribose 5-phosphate isomerase B